MEDFKKLFNLNSSQFTEKKKEGFKVDENIYAPDPEQAADKKVYKSVIRFIPFHGDPDKSKFQKDICIMTNQMTKEKLFIEDPSSFGNFSLTLKYEIMLKKLFKSEPDLVAELRTSFNRFSKFWSLIQIVKDPNRPDMEGKIKAFNFGFNINKLIEAEINPASDGLVETSVSVNPFDLLKGKDFLLVVSKKGKYNNYDGSKFINELTPFKFNGKPTEASEKGMKDVFEYLKNSSPDLMNYYPKVLDSVTEQKVKDMLEAIIPYQKLKDELFAQGNKKAETLAANPNEVKKETIKASDLGKAIKSENETLSKKTETKSKTEPIKTDSDSESEEATASTGNNYKDLLDSL